MILQLLKHSWLKVWRSPAFNQSMVQNIILGLIGLYFLVNMLVLGYFLGDLLEEYSAEERAMTLVVAGLFYYALLDLLTRYFIQKFPAIDIKPYLTLPVQKSTQAHYLLLRSLGSFYNIFPLFFLVPFFFKSVVRGGYPMTQVIAFAIFSMGLILLNNFLSFYIEKRMAIKGAWVGSLLVGIVILFFCEQQGYIQMYPYLLKLAKGILNNPMLAAIPLLLSSVFYYVSHRFFTKNFSLDTNKASSYLFGQNLPIGLFDRFGEAGKLMDLEIKLMLRSQRSRTYLMMSALFLFYPFLLLDMDSDTISPYMLIFVGVIITGMMAMNHGQLMLSWNSLHFDLLQSRSYTYQDLFTAKYYILVLSCIIPFIICLPYFFIEKDIVLFSFALLLYNMSISIFAYMYLASYNSLRVDPNEKGAFNMKGFGAAHFLIPFPIMFLPCFIYMVGSFFGGKTGGLSLIALVGIIGLLLHQPIIRYCVDKFKKNRYQIGAAFRKSSS